MKTISLIGLLLVMGSARVRAQTPAEEDYYRMETLPIPEGVVLEVGGLATLPDGRLGIATRRGDIWLVENPSMDGDRPPHFAKFAGGLHEPLGLAYRDGALYASQRGELTRIRDRDGDDRADVFETVYDWPLAGNYHEYSYGPLFLGNGHMLVTLNLAWIGHGASLATWRGWMLDIAPDGEMTPVAAGFRSPASLALGPEGAVFYAENQGDWIGSGYITHVEPGDFVGNPEGLVWTNEPGVPPSLQGLRYTDIPDTGEPLFEALDDVPALKRPAVWLPHTLLGISTSGLLIDSTDGAFGPFEGQLFVGDQGYSSINRISLEKVNGVFQGAAFPFREGFQSGVLRLAWGPDGSLFVGQTNRGWGSRGRAPYALQRLAWTGEMPFEVRTIEVRPDGFELVFTKPASEAAADPASYDVTSFIYQYHHNYGSPPVRQASLAVRAAELSDDGLRARLAVDGLRPSFVHEIKMSGVRSRDGLPLLHDVAYYTLNELPAGARMAATSGTRRLPGAPTASATSEPLPKRLTTMPASWNGKADATIALGTAPDLHYDLESFDVEAGSHVRFVFTNGDDMLHNVVIVEPRSADVVAQAAIALGLAAHEADYVPESDRVLFHSALLEPRSEEAIYFVAPDRPGDYPFVCTFPGHAATMRGTMRVRAAGR